MSLLLDALKKAAEQKLKGDSTDVAGEQRTETELTLSENQETSPTSSVLEGDTELQFEKEVDETTTFGLTGTHNIEDSRTVKNASTGHAQNSEPLELPDISEEYDLTLQTRNTRHTRRSPKDNTDEKVSMTGNFQKAEHRYQGTPYAASQMFINKTQEQEGRRQRIVILGGIITVLTLTVGGMFLYDYMVSSIDENTASYRPARLRNAIKRTESIIVQEQGKANAATQESGLTVEKEDYEDIFRDENVVAITESEQETKETQPKPVTLSAKTADKPKKIPAAAKHVNINKQLPPETLQDLILAGYEAYQRGDYQTAENAYFNAARRAPDNRDVLLGLAAIALQQGNREQAKRLYQKLLANNPKDANAIAGLAAMHVMQNTKAADGLDETRLKLMLREQPEAHQLHFTLGNQYAASQRWADAQQAYFLAHRYDPGNPDYLFNLAVSLEHLGKNQIAIQFYTQAINAKQHRSGNFDINTAHNRVAALTPSAP